MTDPDDPPAKLRAVVQGDLAAFSEVRGWTHDRLEDAASGARLVLTGKAVRRVLNGLLLGAAVHDVQRWASFMRHGFLEDARSGPIFPLDIEFEAHSEDEIVDAIGRMDELGDAVDGELTVPEIQTLIERLARAAAQPPIGEG